MINEFTGLEQKKIWAKICHIYFFNVTLPDQSWTSVVIYSTLEYNEVEQVVNWTGSCDKDISPLSQEASSVLIKAQC